MNKKIIYASLLSFMFCLPSQTEALEKASQGLLTLFGRYEVEFTNNKRKLEEYAKKLSSKEYSNSEEIKLSVEDLIEHVQKRYEMLEDQYSFTSSEYPGDRNILKEGFEAIEDKYREIREIYDDQINGKSSSEVGRSNKNKEAKKNSKESKSVVGDDTTDTNIKKYREINVSGSYALEINDRTEKTEAQNKVRSATPESKLPNDLSQFRLSLNYEHDENHALYLDERYVQRERNELVRENYLDLSYVIKESDLNAWIFKNSFRISDYLDAEIKDYREDIFEITNERTPDDRRDGTTTLGFQTRQYPHYNSSDFYQFNLSDSETFLMKDSMFVGEGKLEARKYKNSESLDYDNANFFFEYNRKFENDSEVTISNTYDRRLYKHESVNLYRTSYYDNFFRFDYVLPANEKVTYELEAQHNKHEYGSDYERGYSELDLMFAARMKLNNNLRAQLDYKYVDNDENSRILAQKNHEAHIMLLKTVNPVLKIRFDHTYHTRESVIGNAMNFDENTSKLKFSWQLNKEMSIAWNTEYNGRFYDITQYEDYRSYQTGIDLKYIKRNHYEWHLMAALKRMEFRNFYREGAVEPDVNWQNEIQPNFSIEYVKPISKDIRFVSSFSYEKTYYRSYDTYTQDLLYNFAKPMINREISVKLERKF